MCFGFVTPGFAAAVIVVVVVIIVVIVVVVVVIVVIVVVVIIIVVVVVIVVIVVVVVSDELMCSLSYFFAVQDTYSLAILLQMNQRGGYLLVTPTPLIWSVTARSS